MKQLINPPSSLLRRVLSSHSARLFSANNKNEDQELAFKIPNFSRDQRDMQEEYQKTSAPSQPV